MFTQKVVNKRNLIQFTMKSTRVLNSLPYTSLVPACHRTGYTCYSFGNVEVCQIDSGSTFSEVSPFLSSSPTKLIEG